MAASARRAIQAAAGHSLQPKDIQPAMSSMEDDPLIHDKNRWAAGLRRRSFWWMTDLQDLLSSCDVLYVVSKLPDEVSFRRIRI